VGTVVELTVEGVQRTWRTRLEQLDGTRVLVVAPTRGDGSEYLVEPGRGVALSWAVEGALLQAEGYAEGGDVDVVARWWVRIVRVTRLQRRDAYRLRVARPVTLLVEGDHLSGVTSDLSEGGALVVVPAPLDAVPGQSVRVRLTLAADEELLLDADVVRLADGPDGSTGLGLRFRDLDAELSDRVRRFVLDEQLRRRAGGTP
jgi:hypothetical protein